MTTATAPPLPVAELVRAHRYPRFVLLMGLQASGKSTIAEALAAIGYVRINGDRVRAELYGDEAIQGDRDEVFARVLSDLDQALRNGSKVVIDLTNCTPSGRRDFMEKARAADIRPLVLFLDVPLEVCIQRNKRRRRQVPVAIMQSMAAALRRCGLPARSEADVVSIRPQKDGRVSVVPDGEPLLAIPSNAEATTDNIIQTDVSHDVIGDVHGCIDELLELLDRLGYSFHLTRSASGLLVLNDVSAPASRRLVFAGDLVDRGPDSAQVLAVAMQLVQLGHVSIFGNHDHKLMRALLGNKVQLGDDLAETIRQIRSHGAGFEDETLRFLSALDRKYETQDLIVVHAAYARQGSNKRLHALMLYGETDGTKDENGYPTRRSDWEQRYDGGKVIVHGHIPVPEVTLSNCPNGGKVLNVDTGCAFGGKLTALRLPEMQFVQVLARSRYSKHPSIG